MSTDEPTNEQLKELHKDIMSGDVMTLTTEHYRQLEERIKELEEKLEDWENSAKFVLGDDCPTDEIHCGCVIILKKRIKELEALRDTVQISCNPPDDCNDPVVLKNYMKACFNEAMKV